MNGHSLCPEGKCVICDWFRKTSTTGDTEFDEGIAKIRGKDILSKKRGRIVIPDSEEMIGIHLLDRDDQLRKERKDR